MRYPSPSLIAVRGTLTPRSGITTLPEPICQTGGRVRRFATFSRCRRNIPADEWFGA